MLNFYVVCLTDSDSESLFNSEGEPDDSEIKKSSFQVTTRTPSTAGRPSQYGSESSQRMAVRVTTPVGNYYVLTCVMMLYSCISL